MKNLLGFLPQKLTKRVLYKYDTTELTQYLIETIKKSLLRISNQKGNEISCVKLNYDISKSKFYTNVKSLSLNTQYITNYLDFIGIVESRYKNTIMNLSKNKKKRLNRQIIKMKLQLHNPYKLCKLLNFIEKVGNNQYSYSIENVIEKAIIEKRNAYKTILKYSKLNLFEELKRTNIEYKKIKGDFYK